MKNQTPTFDEQISLDAVIESAQKLTEMKAGISVRKNSVLQNPIFVVGSPRSGTTVLGRCIGAHTTCATAEESLVMLPLWRIYVDLYAGGLPSGVAHLHEYISENELINTIGYFSDSIFSSLLIKTGKLTYLDHTPWYGVIAPFIKAVYPNARFIHIKRDGRQVVRSLQDSYDNGYKWAGADIQSRCQVWSSMIHGITESLRSYETDVCTVDYSSLCSSPQQTIEYISDFLKIPFEKEMLTPLSYRHASSSGNSTKFEMAKLQDRYTVDGWPIDWDERMRQEFILYAGNVMNEHYGLKWK